ncbi:MAG: hypothetical protein LQ338_003377 [Usnochroma carphineum]|nr:MAG: hypothetical protein LQ338_003377 [Usnochroma carphineum]
MASSSGEGISDAAETPSTSSCLSSATSPNATEKILGFKQLVFAYFNDEPELFFHVYLKRGDNEPITLFKVNGTAFTIQTTDFLLDQWVMSTVSYFIEEAHVDKDGSCYIQIEYRDATTSEVRRFRSDLPKNPLITDKDEPDSFLPLGWLVENGTDGRKYTTRYVCLLDISTSPISVWLMYDYVFIDFEDDDQVFELEDTKMVYDGYFDGRAPQNMTKARDMVKGQDTILLYQNVADWDPRKACFEHAKLGETSYHLGPSTRAVTRKPPKNLLNGITVACQAPRPSLTIKHWL